MPLQPVRCEYLVPVVADPAAGPAIPAAACQTHRVGVGRSEERLSRGGTPVEQQSTTGTVREAKSSDVHGLRVLCADDVSEAQVQTEATQGAQASAQPVDLHVPVHRLLAYAAGRLALRIEAVGQVGDRLLDALRDRCGACLTESILRHSLARPGRCRTIHVRNRIGNRDNPTCHEIRPDLLAISEPEPTLRRILCRRIQVEWPRRAA